jgi:spore germination protein GerM
LSDIVISKSADMHEEVAQFDYDKALSSGDFQRTGMLNHLSQILLTALSKLQITHLTEESRIMNFLAEIKRKIFN